MSSLPRSPLSWPLPPAPAAPVPSAAPAIVSTPSAVGSHCSPWLTPLVYRLGRYGVLPAYFGTITITGRQHLPSDGPLILAPTHRSRWDPILLSLAVGRLATGRDLRFMVSADEVRGIQGWFIRHLGGFPVDTRRPSVASLRHCVDLLCQEQALVIFPEGNIFRDGAVHPLRPGLARLALQAAQTCRLGTVRVVPVSLTYSHPQVRWGTQVKITIGAPLAIAPYLPPTPTGDTLKQAAQTLTADLTEAIRHLTDPHSPKAGPACPRHPWDRKGH